MPPLYLQGPVVVTGGSGFIGTHLMASLLAHRAKVTNLDIKPPQLPEHRRYWQKIDLNDAPVLHAFLASEKPILIYNLAAHASLGGDAAAMGINVTGVRSILACIEALEHRPYFIHASTQLVAGASSGSFDPTSYRPYGPYGMSKVVSEQAIRRCLFDIHWTIVRPSNIWGPYHPSFANQIWRYIRLRLYLHPTSFDAVRSYGYVENVAYQLLRIAEVEPALVDGKTFYVGDAPILSTVWLDTFSKALTGRPVRRVPGWLLRLAALLGEASGAIGGPSPINLGRLHRMTSDFPVPIEPTFEILGPNPVTLDEGVARTVSWLNKLEAQPDSTDAT